MTAQHSDLVSMWPRKIKHDSLRTAMGAKSLVQSIQSGQCTWASSQATPSHFCTERSPLRPQPAVQSRVTEIAIAFLAKSPDRRSCKRDGRQEDPQVKLCAVFSLEEGTLRTGLSSQAQLQDMQQQQPVQPPPFGLPAASIRCGNHSRLCVHTLKVMDGDAIRGGALAQQRVASENGRRE